MGKKIIYRGREIVLEGTVGEGGGPVKVTVYPIRFDTIEVFEAGLGQIAGAAMRILQGCGEMLRGTGEGEGADLLAEAMVNGLAPLVRERAGELIEPCLVWSEDGLGLGDLEPGHAAEVLDAWLEVCLGDEKKTTATIRALERATARMAERMGAKSGAMRSFWDSALKFLLALGSGLGRSSTDGATDGPTPDGAGRSSSGGSSGG